jgi:ABC-2 type transport system permease protein
MALLFLGLMVLFSGFATLFAGITGEKQQRVTEQMVSMVPPQTWMDGKILGLAAVAMVGTGFVLVSGLIGIRFLPIVLGRGPIPLPPVAFEPGVLALIALVTLLGVMMWFCFLAAIAATIDDPNSSTRSILLFVPMLPTMAAFALIRVADTGIAQAFAIFPFTSMAVLPVRLTMATVPWWEPLLAAVLLAGTALLFRRAAGKIFALGILLHGKEPRMGELWRWMREA